MIDHPITWTLAAPLWESLPDDDTQLPIRLKRPAILRFASDEFMDEFLAALARDPASLAGLQAVHETWRGPAPTMGAVTVEQLVERSSSLVLRLQRLRNAVARRGGLTALPSNGGPYQLKLYQPAHQRFYLIAASLVCSVRGLPDRRVDAARQERASFVLRRLFPADASLLDPSQPLPSYDPAHPEAWVEHAFVAEGPGARWQALDDPDRDVFPGEERLPLFGAAYATADAHSRRLFAGLIPVGRREAYLGAVRAPQSGAAATGGPQPLDPRALLLHMKAVGPWKQLIERARGIARPGGALNDTSNPLPADDRADFLRTLRAQAQTASWYMLLDLKQLLLAELRAVHDAILAANPAGLSTAEGAVYDALEAASMPAALSADLASSTAGYPAAKIAANVNDALRRIGAYAQALEEQAAEFRLRAPGGGAGAAAGWPDFLFLFADAERGAVLPPNTAGIVKHANETDAEFEGRVVDSLVTTFAAALPPPATQLPAPAAGDPRADMRDGWFVIRCLYERPECGALHAKLVSAPTQAFQLAGYFDPDAPARPIRIGLPIDTTPAGLRKFDKKTMVVMSDILCGQIDRMKGLTLGDLIRQVLPFPLHKDLDPPEKGPCTDSANLSLGVMCSLSIPIITLCAIILLMIMVSLLDFVFRWLPWFVICLPLPRFNGKKPGGG